MFKIPFLNKYTKNDNKFITLEIDSAAVRMLTFYKENGSLKIIGSGTQQVEEGAVRNSSIVDFETVAAALEQAYKKATQNTETPIKDVIYGISTDLVIETVTTAKVTRPDTSQIVPKEIDEFEQKILDSAYIDIQNKNLENTGNSDTDFQMITSSNVYTKIDDHKVDTLLGHSGRVAEMAMYTAYCPVYHVENIKKLFKKLGLNLAAITTQNFALVKAMKDSHYEATDMVLLEIGSDFTSIGVVFGGAVVANKSLHIGKKHFVDEISRVMGITFEEAHRVIETYEKGELSNSESTLIQEHINETAEIWLDGLSLAFADFTGVKTFAPNIYLFGEGVDLPEIEEALGKHPWTKAIPFKAPPEITTINLQTFGKISDATDDFRLQKQVSLAAMAYIYEELQ